jgi:hypothetical protein
MPKNRDKRSGDRIKKTEGVETFTPRLVIYSRRLIREHLKFSVKKTYVKKLKRGYLWCLKFTTMTKKSLKSM